MKTFFGKAFKLTDNPPEQQTWNRIRASLMIQRATNLTKTDLVTDCEKIQELAQRIIRMGTDKEIWGVEEYWATPDETLKVRAGDCEDLAILKWSGLTDMGYDPSIMNIVCGFNADNIAHAVLVVEGIVLDCNVPSIYSDIDPVGFNPYLAYGMNENWIPE
jgi:predicted transglutaminase-like cysteine proteinase